MKNPLGFLFSGPKIAEKVLDASIRGMDKLYETAEEKTDAKMAAHLLFNKQLAAQGASQGASSITRRVLAFMLIGLFFLYGLAAGLFWGLEMPERAAGFINLMDSIDVLVGMVMSFYFGRHFVENVFDKKS